MAEPAAGAAGDELAAAHAEVARLRAEVARLTAVDKGGSAGAGGGNGAEGGGGDEAAAGAGDDVGSGGAEGLLDAAIGKLEELFEDAAKAEQSVDAAIEIAKDAVAAFRALVSGAAGDGLADRAAATEAILGYAKPRARDDRRAPKWVAFEPNPKLNPAQKGGHGAPEGPLEWRLRIYDKGNLRVALVVMDPEMRCPVFSSRLPHVYAPVSGAFEEEVLALEPSGGGGGGAEQRVIEHVVCTEFPPGDAAKICGTDPSSRTGVTTRVHHRHPLHAGEASFLHGGCFHTIRATESLLCLHIERVVPAVEAAKLVPVHPCDRRTYLWTDPQAPNVNAAPRGFPSMRSATSAESDALFARAVASVVVPLERPASHVLGQLSLAPVFKVAFEAHCRALSEAVARRHPQQMLPADSATVRSMGQALALYMHAGGRILTGPAERPVLRVRNAIGPDAAPVFSDVMTRCTLHPPPESRRRDQIEVRVHLLADAAETYIHSHKSNCMSFCMSGSYVHTSWGVDADAKEEHHFVVRRANGGKTTSKPQRRSGACRRRSSFLHAPGNVWYLQRNCLHAVSARGDGGGGGGAAPAGPPVVTLFVRDRFENPYSEVVSSAADRPRPGSAVAVGKGEYDGVASTFERVLAGCGATLMGQPQP